MEPELSGRDVRCPGIDGRVRRVVLDEPAELLAGVPVVRLPGIGLVRLSQVEVI
jgi:hypothetical protein